MLSLGFLGPEHGISDPLAQSSDIDDAKWLTYTERSTYRAEQGSYATGMPGVFAAGSSSLGNQRGAQRGAGNGYLSYGPQFPAVARIDLWLLKPLSQPKID